MERIIESGKMTVKYLGKQSVKHEKKYRPFKYIKTVSLSDGLLIYNVMTSELLHLGNEEKKFLYEAEFCNSNIQNYLIQNWFIVPEDCDDFTITKQLTELMHSINLMNKNIPIKTFTILPTTDCNARCFYCYELGGSRIKMAEQTARDVVDFIERKWDGTCAYLRWFGGEPLYNSKIIDIICNGLKEKNITYKSSMISNAYLFNDDMINRAKKLWLLEWVQITLDGTESIYNKSKAYIYKDDPSPFKRVIQNIENILKSGILVRIRLNMDDHNEKDLFDLTSYLLDKFAKFENFSIYSHLLFEDSCARISARADDDRHKLIESQSKLQKFIAERKNVRFRLLKSSDRINHCMSDNDASTMILPDGKLGKCEHYTENNFYGSIYSDEIDYGVLNKFKEVVVRDYKCEVCELRPMCVYPKMCASKPRRCDHYDKMMLENDLENRMKETYAFYNEKSRSGD